MSSLKPDYFIASNGLPNILNSNSNTRQMIRHTRNRTMHNNQQRNLNCLHLSRDDKSHKNKQNFMEACKAPASTTTTSTLENNKSNKRNHLNLKKSRKDLINSEIKASNSHSEAFLSTSSSQTTKIEADNKCKWNFERFI